MLTACGGSKVSRESLTDTAMGTMVNMTIYRKNASEEEALCKRLMEMVREYERECLSWRAEDSLTAKVNKAGEQGEACRVTGEYAELLKKCRELWEDSQGAFDVTLGELTGLWDLDRQAALAASSGQGEKPQIPDRQAVMDALKYCGGEKLQITDNSVRLEKYCRLDLGSIGKGVALDLLQENLEELSQGKSILAGIFSLGGSVMTWRSKPDGSPWKVAVADPFDRGGSIGYLELTGNWCVSTSGDYERYVEVDGVRYHHILDPATGYPARSGVCSVTILSKSGFLSDALSTACFVLGVEKGMALAESYGAEVLFVDTEGKITMSDGMAEAFHGER